MPYRKFLLPIGGFLVALVAGGIFEDRISNIFDQSILPRLLLFWSDLSAWLSSSIFSKISFVILCGGIVLACSQFASYRKLRNLKLELNQAQNELKRTEKKLKDISEHYEVRLRRDPLTNVPNSKALVDFLKIELPVILEDKRAVTFVLFDLHDFGGLNDRFGEARCDDFLKRFAPFLLDQMRTNEPAFRVSKFDKTSSFFRLHTGGDEFLTVVRGTEVDALFLVSRLLDEINHEAALWGELMGEPSFIPRFNLAIYQFVHGVDWLRDLPTSTSAEEEISKSFPRSALVAKERLEDLRTNHIRDMLNIETITEDDPNSLLETVFELKRIAKTKPHGLAIGSECLSPPYTSFSKICIGLSGQSDDFQFARKKLLNGLSLSQYS